MSFLSKNGKALAALLLVLAIALVALRKSGQTIPTAFQTPPVTAAPTPAPGAPATGKSNDTFQLPAAAARATTFASFQARPFAATQTSDRNQWTGADGKDTNIIRQLAHNELEYQRMVEENPRILRRQLVYRKETAAAVMENSKASGQPVTQLTLPGLDGQEVQFNITRANLEPSKQVGTFAGQISNRPNSMVTLSFKFGREAFTVISPDDGIYLQGSPREPGQVIVTSFNPDTYLPLPGGESIKTTNTFKIAQ